MENCTTVNGFRVLRRSPSSTEFRPMKISGSFNMTSVFERSGINNSTQIDPVLRYTLKQKMAKFHDIFEKIA